MRINSRKNSLEILSCRGENFLEINTNLVVRSQEQTKIDLVNQARGELAQLHFASWTAVWQKNGSVLAQFYQFWERYNN
jgi:hypothetical protein